MDFRYDSYFNTVTPEAYERLLCDCILGDRTLFTSNEEVLASWELFSPLLENGLKYTLYSLTIWPDLYVLKKLMNYYLEMEKLGGPINLFCKRLYTWLPLLA